MKTEQGRASLLMALCALLWSIGGLFIKLLPWRPAAICGLRSAIAAVIILGYIRWKGYRVVLSPLVALNGVFLAATLFLFVTANKLTTSANAIVLQSTSPLFILLLSVLFLGARYKRRELAMVAAVMGGVVLCFLDRLDPGGLRGNLIAVASGFTLALMFLTSSRQPDDQSAMSALAVGHGLAALAGLPSLLAAPPEFTPLATASILILGVFQLGIPYLLYAYAARRCSPLSCSLLSMIEPLLNPVWVFLVVDERPGFFALAGGIIVLGTVAAWSVSNARQAGG